MKTVDFRFLIIILILVLFPNFYFTYFKSSSLAEGVLLSCIITFVMCLDKIRLVFKGENLKIVIFCLAAISLISLISFGINSNKESLLFLFFIIIVVSSLTISEYVFSLNNRKFRDTFLYVFIVIVMIGYLNLFGLTGNANYNKSIPPFYEYSHYALAIGLISCCIAPLNSKKINLFIFFNITLQSFLLPSLTLLCFCAVFSIIAFVVHIRSKKFFILMLFISPIVFFISFDLVMSVEYFRSRLIINNTQNLSVLVWVQGWEMIAKAFENGFLFGYGILNLGSDIRHLVVESYVIHSISNSYLNVEDGGFLAAKIIAELGLIGFIIVSIYSFFIFNFLIKLHYMKRIYSDVAAASMAVVIAFVIEMFIRGYGYFSPGVVIFLSFVFSLMKKKRVDSCL